MFENIGKKLMGLAKFICWLGIIASVGFALVSTVISIVSLVKSGGGVGRILLQILLMILEMAAGVLASWLASLGLYAFGQLVDDTSRARAVLERTAAPGYTMQQPTYQSQPNYNAPRY